MTCASSLAEKIDGGAGVFVAVDVRVAVVVGVSTDSAESHRAFATKYSLPFYLASDKSGEIARAFGVQLNNGRAARTSFVVSPDGHIKRVFTGVTPKGHAAELLATLAP